MQIVVGRCQVKIGPKRRTEVDSLAVITRCGLASSLLGRVCLRYLPNCPRPQPRCLNSRTVAVISFFDAHDS